MKHKIVGALVIFLSFAGSWAWRDYQGALTNPAVTGEQVIVDIEKGDSLDGISKKLVAQNLPIKPFWFKVIAFLGKTYKKIKTGEYELKPGLTVPEILDQFVQGKTKQYSITFPEGWNINEILQEVAINPHLEHQLATTDSENLMAQLGIDERRPATAFASGSWQAAEGLFFPDTYFFEKHMSDVSLLRRAYDKMQLVLQQEWLNKAGNLPFKSPYEALILASIVEKETGDKTERPLIAGVFIRRLQHDMLLQTDPTVIYGMGNKFHGNIGSGDLKVATPYNTYVNKGLPPTPIAMPGRDAIYAALHPDNSDNLYFVARGDGSHVFSSSLKDHNLAVNTYQRKKSD